ncbi:hypothetical protein JCM8097_002543 [Rhodosporidiobolus ruineniae]
MPSLPSSAFAAALLVLLPAVVSAQQAGYGRFPCSLVNADGTFSPDPSKCLASALTAPGDQSGNWAGVQGDGVNPVQSECVMELETGSYFCGIVGSHLPHGAGDNGLCGGNTCQGGFNQGCAGGDTNCLGYLYCTSPSYDVTASNTCGGIGAFCQDPRTADSSLPIAQVADVFNQFCASGYCNTATAACDTRKTAGQDCSSDPQFACESGLVCDAATRRCIAVVPIGPPTPSTATTTTTTTTTAATTTQAATTQPPTTAPPASSTHFTVSGSVSTSRPIASPVSISCDNSLAFNNCVKGAQAEYACCMSNGGIDNICYASYKPNLANCYTAAAGNYACTSTSIPDVEACCLSVFDAYFGAGGGEGSSCAA